MRIILCTDCGSKRPPTPHEDADRGIYERYTSGTLLGGCYCDQCNKVLSKGDRAVAVTAPKEMGTWEHQYLEVGLPAPPETQP